MNDDLWTRAVIAVATLALGAASVLWFRRALKREAEAAEARIEEMYRHIRDTAGRGWP